MAATGDVRLALAQSQVKMLENSENGVMEAIQNPKKYMDAMKSGNTSGAGAGGATKAGGGKDSDLSTSTEAYAVQYAVGKWTTASQLATSSLKSMNDSLTAVARNV